MSPDVPYLHTKSAFLQWFILNTPIQNSKSVIKTWTLKTDTLGLIPKRNCVTFYAPFWLFILSSLEFLTLDVTNRCTLQSSILRMQNLVSVNPKRVTYIQPIPLFISCKDPENFKLTTAVHVWTLSLRMHA